MLFGSFFDSLDSILASGPRLDTKRVSPGFLRELLRAIFKGIYPSLTLGVTGEGGRVVTASLSSPFFSIKLTIVCDHQREILE